MIEVFKKMASKFSQSTVLYVHDPLKRFVPENLQGENVLKSLEDKLKGLNAEV
jgi:hypothetical protein